jgi:hypothetical protein
MAILRSERGPTPRSASQMASTAGPQRQQRSRRDTGFVVAGTAACRTSPRPPLRILRHLPSRRQISSTIDLGSNPVRAALFERRALSLDGVPAAPSAEGRRVSGGPRSLRDVSRRSGGTASRCRDSLTQESAGSCAVANWRAGSPGSPAGAVVISTCCRSRARDGRSAPAAVRARVGSRTWIVLTRARARGKSDSHVGRRVARGKTKPT